MPLRDSRAAERIAEFLERIVKKMDVDDCESWQIYNGRILSMCKHNNIV